MKEGGNGVGGSSSSSDPTSKRRRNRGGGRTGGKGGGESKSTTTTPAAQGLPKKSHDTTDGGVATVTNAEGSPAQAAAPPPAAASLVEKSDNSVPTAKASGRKDDVATTTAKTTATTTAQAPIDVVNENENNEDKTPGASYRIPFLVGVLIGYLRSKQEVGGNNTPIWLVQMGTDLNQMMTTATSSSNEDGSSRTTAATTTSTKPMSHLAVIKQKNGSLKSFLAKYPQYFDIGTTLNPKTKQQEYVVSLVDADAVPQSSKNGVAAVQLDAKSNAYTSGSNSDDNTNIRSSSSSSSNVQRPKAGGQHQHHQQQPFHSLENCNMIPAHHVDEAKARKVIAKGPNNSSSQSSSSRCKDAPPTKINKKGPELLETAAKSITSVEGGTKVKVQGGANNNNNRQKLKTNSQAQRNGVEDKKMKQPPPPQQQKQHHADSSQLHLKEIERLRKALEEETCLRVKATRELAEYRNGTMNHDHHPNQGGHTGKGNAKNNNSKFRSDDDTPRALRELQSKFAAEIQTRKRAETEKRKAEQFLASEKRHRDEVERLWKQAENEYETKISQLEAELSSTQEQLLSEQQQKKTAEKEKVHALKLLAGEKRHSEEVARIWKNAEEEYEQSLAQMEQDLSDARSELEIQIENEKKEVAEKLVILKNLESEMHLRRELERLMKDAEQDHEATVQRLQKELAYNQLDLKTERRRRKQLESELLKTETLLARARNESLAQSRIDRQEKEIQRLQILLKKERNRTISQGGTHIQPPSIAQQEHNDHPAFSLLPTTAAPRILKRSDFPLEPPVSSVSPKDEDHYDGSTNKWIGGGSNDDDDDVESEIAAAMASYGAEELSIVRTREGEGGRQKTIQIVRSLPLMIPARSESVWIELKLSIPQQYPSSPIEVAANLAEGRQSNCSSGAQKCAIDAIPSLIDFCRLVQTQSTERCESILDMLASADTWVQTKWETIQNDRFPRSKSDSVLNNGIAKTDSFENQRDEELAILKSIYDQDQLGIVHDEAQDEAVNVIYKTGLPVFSRSEVVPLQLKLTLSKDYPTEPLAVDVILLSESSSAISTEVEQFAKDATTSLAELCTYEANAFCGQEAIIHIITTAENWINIEWAGMQSKRFPPTAASDATAKDGADDDGCCYILSYCPHIIDPYINNYAKQIATKLSVRGVIKTGRPSFCLFEGDEANIKELLKSLDQMQTKIRTSTKRKNANTPLIELGRSSLAGSVSIFTDKLCQLEGGNGLEEFEMYCKRVGLYEDLTKASSR